MMLIFALLVRFASCGTYYILQTPTELHTGWHNGYGACRPNIKPKETECVSEVMTNVIINTHTYTHIHTHKHIVQQEKGFVMLTEALLRSCYLPRYPSVS